MVISQNSSNPENTIQTLLLLLLACNSGIEDIDQVSDAEHYIQSALAETLEGSRSSCLEIQEIPLQGLCMVELVQKYGMSRPEEVARICETVTDSSWRDECYFRLAEALPVSADPAEFLARCAAAGTYEQKCLYHCFPRYGLLMREGRDALEAFNRYDAMVQMLGPREDLQRTAWSQFTRARADNAAPVELEWCERIDEARARACVKGLTEGQSRQLPTNRTRGSTGGLH